MHIYSMPQPQKLASAEIPTIDRFRNFHVICSLSESEDSMALVTLRTAE